MDDYKKLDIYKSWIQTKLYSSKGNIYFYVYDEIFQKFRNKEIIFVEIGVKRGGSLLMWRDWLGPKARIIGIDLDPNAKKLEEYGFEIYIGDQSSTKFWTNFFEKVGMVDVILDDGGHTNENQIMTTINCTNHINDGGLLVIEDISANYAKKFFNPQKYSFINYSKFLIDDINVRSLVKKEREENIKKNSLNDKIYSIRFFSEFVIFEINRDKCIDTEFFWNKDLKDLNDNSIDKITNVDNYVNPRWSTDSYKGLLSSFVYFFSKVFFFIKYIPFSKYLVEKIILFKGKYYTRKNSSKLKKYFE